MTCLPSQGPRLWEDYTSTLEEDNDSDDEDYTLPTVIHNLDEYVFSVVASTSVKSLQCFDKSG